MMLQRIAPLALLALAACGSDPKPTGGSADGEILPGSASDAMLPLDTVRSQPPLAPKVAESGKADEDKAGPRKPATKEPASSAPAPVATPEPAADAAE